MSVSDRFLNGHSIDKHIDEFKDLGIETPEEYIHHIDDVIEQSECFTAFSTTQTWRQADIFYHASSNTLVIVPENPEHEPTAFRPEEGRKRFDKKHDEAQRIEQHQIEIFHGIKELDQAKRSQELKSDSHPEQEQKWKAEREAWLAEMGLLEDQKESQTASPEVETKVDSQTEGYSMSR